MNENQSPRRDYRETRAEASSSGAGWLIAGVAIAALVAVGAWIYSGTTTDTVATDGTPAVTDQVPTDTTETGSVTGEEPAPMTNDAPAATDTAPMDDAPATQAAPETPAQGDEAPAGGTDTTPPAQ
ncbi:MAG: hypothetical protein R3D65_12585 [Zhengella sp.]|uniref:hypothetical protein n=1 Tax=Zhengella sp. TaxID=2282762 RepID=UPI001D528155|nr:hypothetical protein [Notoacmeibacter sp.]MCC0028628.1 hypothetical protein [Brucellaceae bacterium]